MDVSPFGRIVLGDGQLYGGAVRQGNYLLDDAFSKARRTDQGPDAIILDGTRKNLRGAGAISVNQYRQRDVQLLIVNRVLLLANSVLSSV